MGIEEIAKKVQAVNDRVSVVVARRARWNEIAPGLKANLAKLVREANALLKPNSTINLLVRQFPAMGGPEFQVLLGGNNPTGVVFNDGEGTAHIVERGAMLRFRPDISGMIGVMVLDAKLDYPGTEGQPRDATMLKVVEPDELASGEGLDEYFLQFLTQALERHWTTSEASKKIGF